SYKSNRVGFRWNRHLIHFLDGLAIGDRVGKAVIARDRFSDRNSIRRHGVFKEPLRSFVRIEKLELKVQNGVSNDTKTKMTRFNNSSMHRPYGHLTYTLALHFEKLRAIGGGYPVTFGTAMAQQWQESRMAGKFDAVLVMHFLLMPGGRRSYRDHRSHRTGRRVL